jgi:hypothetical protein
MLILDRYQVIYDLSKHPSSLTGVRESMLPVNHRCLTFSMGEKPREEGSREGDGSMLEQPTYGFWKNAYNQCDWKG